MGVDQVDLIQLHNLVEPEDWDTANGPGGAVEALAKARDEGLCRFIGVTGHGIRIAGMHIRSLEAFPFDSVLLPYNHSLMTRPDYRGDVEALLTLCAERGVAVQTIKSIARRRWAEAQERRFSWYEPIDDPDALARGVNYVLSKPDLFLNTSSDARLLPLTLAAAAGETVAPSDEEMGGRRSTAWHHPTVRRRGSGTNLIPRRADRTSTASQITSELRIRTAVPLLLQHVC